MDFSDPGEASSQGPGLWPEYSSDEERSCSSPSEMEVLDDPAREGESFLMDHDDRESLDGIASSPEDEGEEAVRGERATVYGGTSDISVLCAPKSPPCNPAKRAKTTASPGKGSILDFFRATPKPPAEPCPPPQPPPSLSELQELLPAGACVFSDQQERQPTISESIDATIRKGDLKRYFTVYNPEGDGHCVLRCFAKGIGRRPDNLTVRALRRDAARLLLKDLEDPDILETLLEHAPAVLRDEPRLRSKFSVLDEQADTDSAAYRDGCTSLLRQFITDFGSPESASYGNILIFDALMRLLAVQPIVIKIDGMGTIESVMDLGAPRGSSGPLPRLYLLNVMAGGSNEHCALLIPRWKPPSQPSSSVEKMPATDQPKEQPAREKRGNAARKVDLFARFPWLRKVSSGDKDAGEERYYCAYCAESRVAGKSKWSDSKLGVKLNVRSRASDCTKHTQNQKGGTWGGVNRDHQEATQLWEQRQRGDHHNIGIPAVSKQERQLTMSLIRAVSKVTHFIGEHELPYSMLRPLCDLIEDLAPDAGVLANYDKYQNRDQAVELVDLLGKVFENRLLTSLKASPMFGIGFDESTDRGCRQNLAIIFSWIDPRSFKRYETLIHLEDLEGDATGESLTTSLTNFLSGRGIDIKRLACVGSDGAKACFGGNLGVRGRIQSTVCSKIVFFWCGGHRVNLCLSDACEQAGGAFAELESLLKLVYLYVSGSPKRRAALKDICQTLDQQLLVPVNFVATRWISRFKSVNVVVRQLHPLLNFFRREAEECSEAGRIYNLLTDARVVVALHGLNDILVPVNQLSQTFQERGASIFKALRAKDECVAALEHQIGVNLDGTDGDVVLPSVTQFIESCSNRRLQSEKVFKDHIIKGFPLGQGGAVLRDLLTGSGLSAFSKDLLESVRDRFFEDCDAVVQQLAIFDPAAWVGQTSRYGRLEINLIGNHFSTMTWAGDEEDGEGPAILLNAEELEGEWATFKMTTEWRLASAKENRPEYCSSQELFWGHFFSEGSGSDERVRASGMTGFRSLKKVVILAIIIMIGNAEAERAFSAMNRICCDERTRLLVEHTRSLMLCSIGPRLGARGDFPEFQRRQFNFNAVWKLWMAQKMRRPGDLLPVTAADIQLSKMQRMKSKPRKKDLGEGGKTTDGEQPDERREDEGAAAEEEELEGGEGTMLDFIENWGPEDDYIDFLHEVIDQDERDKLARRGAFQDEGEWWVILDLGFARKTDEPVMFYVKRAHISEWFPGKPDDYRPLLSEVYSLLRQQTDAMSAEELSDPDVRPPLQNLEWSCLKVCLRYEWIGEDSPTVCNFKRYEERKKEARKRRSRGRRRGPAS